VRRARIRPCLSRVSLAACHLRRDHLCLCLRRDRRDPWAAQRPRYRLSVHGQCRDCAVIDRDADRRWRDGGDGAVTFANFWVTPSDVLAGKTDVVRGRPGEFSMSKLKIDQGDWVIVCDGAKALVLENVGDDKVLNLKTKEVYEQSDPKTREQGTDAPGRSINSVGEARSAVEQTDWHDEAERSFLVRLAGRLDVAIRGGETKRL